MGRRHRPLAGGAARRRPSSHSDRPWWRHTTGRCPANGDPRDPSETPRLALPGRARRRRRGAGGLLDGAASDHRPEPGHPGEFADHHRLALETHTQRSRRFLRAPVDRVGRRLSDHEQTGLLPSDRLVDLAISSTPTHDLLTFVFNPSIPGPAGPPRGTLEAAVPPFTFAGSGQAFDLLGQHAVQVRFSGMTLADESGKATYRGPTEVKPLLTTLREAVQYDASEGIVGWDVGYDGPGCVTLLRDGNTVTIMIAHPEAPAG